MMKLEYETKSSVEKRKQEVIKNLVEEQRSDFKFNDEFFYNIGSGHDFLYSFFTHFITKSGVEGILFYHGLWIINGTHYIYENGNFIEKYIEPVVESNINWNEIQFPIIKNINPKLLKDEIQSVQPRPFQ